ncbi:MAG: hypothetical protein JWL59_3784 [Chthoniobacteraceae bacterium]|nr:hypothetical protein [Chthoniobacteraceae bacterium]
MRGIDFNHMSSSKEWITRAGLLFTGIFAGWFAKTGTVSQSGNLPHPAKTTVVRAEAAIAQADKDRPIPAASSAKANTIKTRFGLAMLQGSPFRRQADFLKELENLTPEDADGVRKLFGEFDRQGMEFPYEWSAFYQRWGQVDPARAIEHALADPGVGWAPGAMKDAFNGWASRDPAAAAAWLQAHPESPNFDSAFLGYVAGFAGQDLQGATRMALESVPSNHHAIGKVAESLAEAAVRQGQLRGMESWYDGLPDHGDGALKRAAFGHVYWREKHAGQEVASEWLASQASNPWRGDQQYGEMAEWLANRDPDKALGWMANLPPSPTDGTWPGMGRVLRRWRETNPQAADAWIQTRQPGTFGDYARATYEKLLKPAVPVVRRLPAQ